MKKLILLTMVLLVCGVGTASAAIYATYDPEITELSYNASNQDAKDINNAGQITGTSWDGHFAYMRNANGDASYLYAQTAAGVGTHARTYGHAINASGNVITTGGGSMTGNVYVPLLYTSIAPPAHAYNPQIISTDSNDGCVAINSQYVGGYHNAQYTSWIKQARIWDFSGTQVYSYGDMYQNRWYTDASANNVFVGQVGNAGSIITSYDSGTSTWSTVNYSDPAYGSITAITSVNTDGSVFCGHNASTGTYRQAVVWGYNTGGSIVQLASLGVSDSSSYAVTATAISSDGKVVVGIGRVGSGAGEPVVWEAADDTWTSYTQYTFESLLPVAEQGLWANVVLTGVNDSGAIVGYGNYNSQAYTSGFVLVPEPATMSLLVAGLGFFLVRREK